MKDRILNTLMLLAVAAALILSLVRGAPTETDAGLPLPVAAVPTPAPTAAPHPADAYRAERADTRAKEEALLLALISSPQTAPDARTLAEAAILDMTKNDEIELAVEAALAAEGFDKGLCVAREGEVTVFFPGEITEREAAFILDIACSASGLDAQNIRLTGFSFAPEYDILP